jgi:hypothetical protein
MTVGIDPLAIATEVRLHNWARENLRTKARRYLIEARLTVRRVTETEIDAFVRGTERTHHVGYRRGGYFCDCEARGRCSHLEALQLVTQRPGETIAQEETH